MVRQLAQDQVVSKRHIRDWKPVLRKPKAQLFPPLLGLSMEKLLLRRAEAHDPGWDPAVTPLPETLGQMASATTGLLKAKPRRSSIP